MGYVLVMLQGAGHVAHEAVAVQRGLDGGNGVLVLGQRLEQMLRLFLGIVRREDVDDAHEIEKIRGTVVLVGRLEATFVRVKDTIATSTKEKEEKDE